MKTSRTPSLAASDNTHKKPARRSKNTDPATVRAYPVLQQRSQQNKERLLSAGRDQLKHGGFDEMSIAQLATYAGCSVGVFYQRFRNKQAYFEFLLDTSVQEVRENTLAQMNAGTVRGLSLSATVDQCVQHYIDIHRQHAGLIRAALQYSINGSDDWQPLRQSGLWLHQHYMGLILAKTRTKDKARLEQQGLIGFQLISGHLVNSIAHPANLLPLEHPHLRPWLSQVVMLCLKTPPRAIDTPGRPMATPPARP